MNILVFLRMVPDVVEELEVDSDGKSLDAEYLRMILSESDDHALEQALILKERHGGAVTVIAADAPDVESVLFTALAKGVDRAVRISVPQEASTRRMAQLFSGVIAAAPRSYPADLVLTGVQAIDDLDGLMAPLLSHHLKLPYLGIVTGITVDVDRRTLTAVKEYPGGLRGEFELPLPAVLGVQAAERPPRYVPVAKVRAAMKSQKIETVPGAAAAGAAWHEVITMKKPTVAGHADMLEGTPEEVSERLMGILTERGVLS